MPNEYDLTDGLSLAHPIRSAHRRGLIAALVLGAGMLTGAAQAQDRNDQGWTVLEPSVDTRFVFVSASEGDDHNSGLSPSRAVRTLTRAEELMRDGHPDWLLLKRGDVWDEGFGTWGLSGRSDDERLVISSYGEGEDRPRIELADRSAIVGKMNQEVSHVAIVGLAIVGDRTPGDSSIGIRWLSQGSGLLIEDCFISGFKDNIVCQAVGGRFEGIEIRRNVVVDSWSSSGHSQGLYVKNGDDILLEENLFDHNGWNPSVDGAHATMFNQNIYLQTNTYGVEFHGNLTARAGAAGVQMRTGGNASDNLIYANPLGIRFGYDELDWPSMAASGSIVGNVVLGGDLSNPEMVGAGIGMWIERVRDTLIKDNVVAHLGDGSRPKAFTLNGYAQDVSFIGNAAFDFVDSSGVGFAIKSSAQVTGEANFVGNHWSMPGTNRIVDLRHAEGIRFLGNDMFGIESDEDVFFVEGTKLDYDEWIDRSFVTEDAIEQPVFVDAERDLDAYARHIGYEDADELLLAARAMSRSNWDVRLTGRAAARWIRSGYLSSD